MFLGYGTLKQMVIFLLEGERDMEQIMLWRNGIRNILKQMGIFLLEVERDMEQIMLWRNGIGNILNRWE